MYKLLLKLFPKLRPPTVCIQAPGPSYQLLSPAEAAETVAALQFQPGFQHLLASLALQRAAMEKKLRSNWHTTLQEVTFLQSGLYWLGWLEAQLLAATERPETRDATTEEMAILQPVFDSLELVGQD